MSVILEVYYRKPIDLHREEKIVSEAGKSKGVLGFREEPIDRQSEAICLTLEFPNHECATRAAAAISKMGEHVEGPSDYE